MESVVKTQSPLTKAQAVAAIERLARADRRYAATVDQWDTDDWLLNTPSGIVDLRTGELQQHDPLRYMTKQTSVAPGGDCQMWQRFLDDITAGDKEYITFLQRVLQIRRDQLDARTCNILCSRWRQQWQRNII